jgi:drug/metabolite transporter (DMT)-like permease
VVASGSGPRAGRWLGAGELSVLAAAAGYGLSTTLSVIALRAVRPVDLAAVELGGASIVLLVVAAATGRLGRRGAVRHLLLGALDPGLVYLLADFGLARTSAADGSLLLAVDPLLSVLLAVVILAERLTGRGVVALVVGFSGSALVAFRTGHAEPGRPVTAGNLFVLAAVVTAATFLVLVRRFGRDTDGVSAGTWQITGGAIAVAPFVAASWHAGGSRLATADVTSWAACLAVLLCGAVATVAFNHGIRRVPAARAGQLLNLTPAVGLLTAVALLGERPSVWQLGGGASIILGLALLLRSQPQPADDRAHADPTGQAATAQPASHPGDQPAYPRGQTGEPATAGP